jgi:hypothetical protein
MRHLVNDQQAIGFLVSQTSYIEAQVIEIKYPDIQYAQLIPVDTSANEWAKSVTYYSVDKTGKAGWFALGRRTSTSLTLTVQSTRSVSKWPTSAIDTISKSSVRR